MNKLIAAPLLAVAMLASACGASPSKTTTTTASVAKKLSIVVTTTQIGDFVKTLGADKVTVYAILKPGTDPHYYKLTPDDINAISTADLIIKNGAGLEPWFESAITASNHSGPIVDASSGIVVRPSADPKASLGDPHIWMSVVNAKLMVANIANALVAGDPADKDLYGATERAYDSQLDGFTNEARQSLGALNNKFLITDHEAYDYFCDEFGLQCVASVTPVSGAVTPPTDAQISAVAAQLKGQSVLAVFTQANGTPAAGEELATDLGVKVEEGNDGLYGDSLGAVGGDADTYLKMMSHDLNSIVANLH